MKTYLSSQKLDSSYPQLAVVAIGNFDGVHLGHQEILKTAQSKARLIGCPTTVFTFNPHPTLELRPQAPLKLLMTYEEKKIQLENHGVDFCVEEPFNSDFAKTTAHDFFYEVLLKRLKAKVIVVGEDFFFGHKREGTIDLLKSYCTESGTELIQVMAVLVPDENGNTLPVSSSRIREVLLRGNLNEAEKLLGSPFFYRGEIVHGDKRGRTIGFPTANMKCGEKFPLLPGVYATSVKWRNKIFPSVTNIGIRPTFQDPTLSSAQEKLIPLRIETYLLDQDFDLYGELLEVSFYERLREEKRFQNIDELKEQISADIILARTILTARNF